MRKFLVVIEKGKDGYGAYSPDLPGCVAVGATKAETEKKIYEAIAFHLEGMRLEGIHIPKSESVAEYLLLPEPA
jgi:predicted RNase H-like HicB family nuclease